MKLTGKKENFDEFLFKVDELGYAINDLLPASWTLNLSESTNKLSELLSDSHLKIKQKTVTSTDSVAIQIKTSLQDTELQVSASSVVTLESENQLEYVLNWWQWQINCQLALIAEISNVFETTEEYEVS
ncbi:hypothetical protein AAA431_07145 [Lactobacillus crispatus]|jgi:hypothetical protein|uniref:Uncharacterized protein n=1 Tax=Lactobacillus crispatus TaxID=47770 RepID=A0A109DFS0_9LACO|nr:hypothetical protein [Lactobacillus crispatus]MDU7058463.1 hypothetical protein [Ligilactobacillus salivarius]AZR16026.1 hypothetical protein C3K22_08615 [Lactobacillus crispatus]EKB63908.1 hypothetical protein HMPREF9250_00125 [Lactobacillus crispatus FB049-03]KWU04646.1 hypothetical protein AEL95_02040 [Lactobacillus crispatus]KWU12705.1 hypothetical protein AEL97_02605 [Lactobacillus crispatus]